MAPPYPARMDKVDYEAKLASEVEKLRNYQKSLAEEHAAIVEQSAAGEPKVDAEAVYDALEQKFLKAVGKASDAVVELIEHADKDTTRLAAAKFVITAARATGHTGKEDPFEELLRKINRPTAEVEE